jgi:hypothetical protein
MWKNRERGKDGKRCRGWRMNIREKEGAGCGWISFGL